METNAKLIAFALLFTTLVAPQSQAQNPVNSDAPAPPIALSEPGRPGMLPADGPLGRPGRPGRPGFNQVPGRQPGGLTSLTTVSGTVGQWVGNDDAILDGFTLTSGSGTPTTVKFPSHLGQQVQKAIKSGSNVSVTGFSETTPQGETRFRMNNLTVGKTTVYDAPPTPRTTAPEPPALSTVSGKIVDYRLNREGRVSGFVLDNKTIVNIPPHVAYQLTELAKKGSAITVQGYPKDLNDGQVQLEKLNILRASVLTINGQQYLVR